MLLSEDQMSDYKPVLSKVEGDWRRIHTRYDRCAHAFMSAICISYPSCNRHLLAQSMSPEPSTTLADFR